MTDMEDKVQKSANKKFCSVPDCKGQGASMFHKFPLDEAVKRKWIETCHITKPVTTNSYICSSHFSEEDYSCLKPKRLRRFVVPSKKLIHEEPDFEEFDPEKEISGAKQNDPGAVLPTFVKVDILSHKMHGDAKTAAEVLELEKPTIGQFKQIKRVCCISDCHAKSSQRTFFHTFPKLKRIYQQWYTACNLSGPVKYPLFVCNSHFRKEDYLNLDSKTPILKSNAIPCLNMPRKPKFRVVFKEENNEKETSITVAKDGEDKEKVTTIIYVPKNCKSVVAADSEPVQVVKAQDYKNKSMPKNASNVLQNQNPIKTATQQEKVIVKIQSNAITKNQSKVVVQQKQSTDKEEQPNTSDNEVEITSVLIKNDSHHHKPNSTVRTKEEKKNTVPKYLQVANERIKKNVSAITLCADCGQYTTVSDEDLIDIKKNPETLAAEALLELQEVNPPNEDERTVITRKGIEICDRVIRKKRFSLLGLLNNDLELMAFTGINIALLDRLANAVTSAEGPKCVAKISHPPRERIALCLCKLRTNLSFRSLAAMFGLTQIVCSSYFFAMVRTLAGILKHTIYWSKTEELLKNLPEAFQSFKQTRVILNCTEAEIEKQRCPKCKYELLEKKIEYESVKFVLGVAPNGLVIFKSKTFDAQGEDTSVFTQTALLESLDPMKEAIMADNSLNIEAECVERNITLIKALRLEKNKQYSAKDVELIKNVCAARVHVDRTLQRIKMYKVLQTKISWRLLPYLDDICTIVAGVVNLKNPILPDDVHLAQAGLKV
ncbi:uncharacterized protein LOC100679641 [Nasonia vitripennis]|uniref:THAP-type domain-containing protein n=1 Tax=Nasonia vitripennis TaxID=7425 RepID=A0A7M7LNS9_NASVI|nr:uncharacterized protein LOC100679641 [Nasonia vitripennis]